MLEAGIYLSPSQAESNFISTQHTCIILERTLSALKKTPVIPNRGVAFSINQHKNVFLTIITQENGVRNQWKKSN